MWRCEIVTWILILSIINFTLGAPAAVRERLEMSVDVDLVERRTATSQKRHGLLARDDWSTTADRRPPTSSLNPTVTGPHPDPTNDSPPPPPLDISINPDTLSSTGHQPTPPQSPDGDIPSPPPAPPQSSDGNIPLPPPTPPHPGQLAGLPEDRFPSTTPGWPVDPDSDTLSSTGSSPGSPRPPQNPGLDPEIHSLLSPESFPTEFWDEFLKDIIRP